jgi:hypothetical protein
VDQGEGKADGQTGESLGRPDLRLHDLRHSGAVLAALTGPTLAADGLPGSLPPAAAMRFQHAAKERDKIIAAARSRLARG